MPKPNLKLQANITVTKMDFTADDSHAVSQVVLKQIKQKL